MIDSNLVIPWSWKRYRHPERMHLLRSMPSHHETNLSLPPLRQFLISIVLACHENCMNEFMRLFLPSWRRMALSMLIERLLSKETAIDIDHLCNINR
jgi:hypothetical protein